MTNFKIIKKAQYLCPVLVFLMILTGVILTRDSYLSLLRVNYIRDVAVDALGMLVCGVLIIGIVAENEKDKQSYAMLCMIVILVALFYVDLVSSYLEGNSKYVMAIKLVNTVYFIFEDLLAYSYYVYIREELKLNDRLRKITNLICRLSLGFTVAIDLLNLKLGYFFTVSPEGEYVDSKYEFASDLAIITVFIIAFFVISYVKDREFREKLVLLTFIAFPFWSYIYGIFTLGYVWMMPAYLLSIMLIYIRIFLERGKKLAKQQALLTKQSTALMVSQIQPHFLYNVLTTISNLCVTDPEEAEETTVLFSQYLRTNLDSLRNEEPVPFSTELSHIKTYVELEKKRFGEKLNVEYDIKETNFKVPSLGLQPIVENSIKHGIRGKNEPGCVKISSYAKEGGAMVIIEDDGIGFDMNMPPKEDGRSHVGMINVKSRLKQMCNASVDITSSPGNGCRTEIFIPTSL